MANSASQRYKLKHNFVTTMITGNGLLALRELRLMTGILTPLVLEAAVLHYLQHERDRRGLYPTTIRPKEGER